MFERKVKTLEKILNHLDGDFFKSINEDKELYYACRSDYISIYYKGIVWAKVGPESINLGTEISNRIQCFECRNLSLNEKLIYFLKNSKSIKNEIDKTNFTKKQIERKNETKLASEYGFSKEMVVIDIEATIPKDEKIISRKTGDYKKAEIDMVVFDEKRKILYLTEYKCKESSMKNASGVIEHYSDMIQVLEKCRENFVKAEIDVYNMMTGKSIDYSDVEIKIALCFSDIDSAKVINVLDCDEIEQKDSIYIWVGEALDAVDFAIQPETVLNFVRDHTKR